MLYIGYFLEVLQERGSFTGALVAHGFKDARIRAPGNVYDVIGRLKVSGDVIQLRPSEYALGQSALAAMTQKLSSLGLFTTKPEESTELIREVSEKLHRDLLTILDKEELSFMEEAATCLHPTVNAYRAAIIMGWAAVVHNLRRKLLAIGLKTVDQAIKKHSPRKKAERESDLDDLKDSELLLVCDSLGILTKTTRQRLEHALNLRNSSAHPTELKPHLNVVRGFFEEIIQYVLAVP